MIVVHHLNNSRSQRVLWLLEELGVCPTRCERYQRDPEDDARAARAEGGASAGQVAGRHRRRRVLAESGAIIEYLADRYGDGRLARPHGSPERFRYIYWLHYAEGSAMPPLLLKLVFDRVAQAPMPFFVQPDRAQGSREAALTSFIAPQLKLHLDYLEGELGTAPGLRATTSPLPTSR